MRIFVFLLAILGVGAAHSATVTVDFHEFEGLTDNLGSPVVSQGYSFVSGAGFLVFGDVAIVPCPDCTMTITNVAGEPFSLRSLDLRNLEFFGTGDAVVAVTGNYVAGGEVSMSLMLPASATTNFSFNSDWSGLQSVTFGTASTFSAIAYDNVVLSTVPIPAAAWLFASALAGLGWLRRKNAV